MTNSPGDFYDRLSILYLKRERQEDYTDDGEIEELERVVKRCASWDQDLFVRLEEVNGRIWDLESDLRLGKEGLLGLEEVGRRALKIRDLNKLRIELRNEINRVCSSPRLETKSAESLDNVIPTLLHDRRWLSILYRRAEAETLQGRRAWVRYITLLVATVLSGTGFLALRMLHPIVVLSVCCLLGMLEISQLIAAHKVLRRSQGLLAVIDVLKLRPNNISLDKNESLLDERRFLVSPRNELSPHKK